MALETTSRDCSIVSSELAKLEAGLRALRESPTDRSAELQAAHDLLITYAESLNATVNALHRANQELEDRVRERTRELLILNEKMQGEILEKARAESSLRASEHRYRVLADQIPDTIFVLDPSGKIIYVNHQVKDILGLSLREVVGTDFARYVTPEDRAKITDLLKLQPDIVWDEEIALVNAQGESVFSRIRCRPFYDQMNEELRFEGVMRDITERKHLEGQLRASRQDLMEKIGIIDDLYAHIIESSKAKAIWDHSAVVAHELRQPLAIIGGFARRTAKSLDAADNSEVGAVRRNIGIIIHEIERLEKILSGLIEFTSSQGLSPSLMKPGSIIDCVLGLFSDVCREKRITPVSRFEAKEEEICGDPARFEQAVRNLFSIAMEICPPGQQMEIETRIAHPGPKAHETAGLEADAYFQLKVRCHGACIEAEELEKVFSPFYSTTVFGAGIGLVITRRIVEDHHGSISIHCDSGGAAFTVWLPLAT